jgi:peptidyl-tRNA hydrolase
MKLYIAVLDSFPDYMVPTLVAHAVLAAHMKFSETNSLEDVEYNGLCKNPRYIDWLENSYKKCVIRVNQKEFNKIKKLSNIYIGHESNTLNGEDSCIIVCPMPDEELPNVLKFAKLWKPKQ